MTYDAENRLINAGGTTYSYDGDGNRVKKQGTSTTYYWGSGPLAESDMSGSPTEYIYFNGKRVARVDLGGNVSYYFSDHLGSASVVTDNLGNIKDESDYYPYGGEIPVVNLDPNHFKFTGKERDSETGLDYFGFRYYSGAQGRWTSPDEPLSDQHLEDPQSWNMYSYVRNNPLAHVDPNGKACFSFLGFGNTGSGFCERAEAYANFDSLVHDKTRFFAAASAATQELADVAVPLLGRAGTTPDTRRFLEDTGKTLLSENTHVVGEILSGQISGSGSDLDAQIVHREQNVVQKGLDDFKRTNPTAYGAAIMELNALLNGKSSLAANALGAFGRLAGTDKAYAKVLADVRQSLGRDINFANQADREAIGKALAKHARENNGCDVTSDKAHGCGH